MKITIFIVLLSILCPSNMRAVTLSDTSIQVKGFKIKVENLKTDSAQLSWDIPITYRLGAFDFTEANMSIAEILRFTVNVVLRLDTECTYQWQ